MTFLSSIIESSTFRAMNLIISKFNIVNRRVRDLDGPGGPFHLLSVV